MADQIKVINITQRGQWQSIIETNPEINFVDYWSWLELVNNIYNIPYYHLAAYKGTKPSGYVALSHCKHPILGNYLATAPYDNYGGVYYEDAIVRDALIKAVEELAQQLKVDYIVVRHAQSLEKPPVGWLADPIYATYVIPIAGTPETFLKDHLKAKQRNQLKKSMTHGLVCQVGGIDLMDDFFNTLKISMHDLGSPWHTKGFFEELSEGSGMQTNYFIVRLPDGEPVAASLLIRWLNKAVVYHANTINRYNNLYTGDFLYWHMIKYCYENEITSLDFGRSIMQSGNEHFKMKWNPIKRELAYWYKLLRKDSLPSLNQTNPKFSIAILLWRIMPACFLGKISKFMIRGLI